ncbi:hypothetical protein BGZ76_005699 [Entomortierella beljakovae]|nr:hypothetical protein BGZ76_005699 [Entomortierella beljakovae]
MAQVPGKSKNTTGLVGQLIISTTLGVFAFLTFCTLRTRWVTMFAPRSKLRRNTPPVISSTFFGWIPQLLRIPESEYIKYVGLDAVVLLRFFRMSMRYFFYCLIPGVLVVMPVNYYSIKEGYDPSIPDGDEEEEESLIPRASLLYLFTQFTVTWAFSLLLIYTLWRTYESYITLRREFTLKNAGTIANRSVMVVGIPPHIQSDRSLATFYEAMGVGAVESAHICRHVRRLKGMVEQRAHALRELEEVFTKYYGNPSEFPGYNQIELEAEYERYFSETHDDDHSDTDSESSSLLSRDKNRPTIRLGFLGLFGKKVDKIDHCKEVFSTLDKAVLKLRNSKIFPTTTTGFVTFEEMHAAQVLAQTVNTQETLSCETTLAPEPRDVVWDNLSYPASELGIRSVVINTVVFFLIFFWSGPIGVFSSFLNLDSLEKLIPGVTAIAERSPALKSLIQGFLPTVGVSIFLSVVPKILEALCFRQGIQSHTGLARSLYNKYFTFILFNVVLVFTVAGTWAQMFNKVYHNFGDLALLLATSLPRVSPFFVNYLILKSIGIFPLQLLQIGEVFVHTFHGILSKTPRDYAEARAPPPFHHGVVFANTTLAFVIVLIYSCIKPLILVFGVIYFALAYLIFKYQLLYVLYNPFRSNGCTWPMVYNRVIVGLTIFQLTMLGIFMLHQSYLLGALLAPLPFGTLWFWAWTTKKYKRSAEHIPLELIRPKESSDSDDEDYEDDSSIFDGYAPSSSVVSTTQVPGHVLIDIDQNNNGSANKAATSNGVTVASATNVITPGGTVRRIPKSAVENDDYQAIPDRRTDYSQPPMTVYPGILNACTRHYIHPAISGPLPTLWLPLSKTYNAKSDEESRIGGNLEHRLHARIDEALAQPPLYLPTQSSDEPQTAQESSNLTGEGHDASTSAPGGASGASGAGTSQSGSRPTQTGETSAAGASGGSVSRTPSKRNPASDGVSNVYYHHPERMKSMTALYPKRHAIHRPRTVEAQPSRETL